MQLISLLSNGKSPSRKVKELDNRGSHFYLAKYWAEELAKQDKDVQLKTAFMSISEVLSAKETKIIEELNNAQGDQVSIGGYYFCEGELEEKAMRPSETLNEVIASI